MGLLFWPRGGSAQVARYLAQALARARHPVTLACGSVSGMSDGRGDARTFHGDGIDLVVADYAPALARYSGGMDPMESDMPLHPSYEDRDGVPDRLCSRVSPALAEHAVDAWTDLLQGSPQFCESDIFHLHHLTAIHDAVERLRPDAPVVTHLHGTELKMLDAIDRTLSGEDVLPADAVEHGAWWLERARHQARRSSGIITIAPHDRSEAQRLLGVDAGLITTVPNGVDIERFRPRSISADERRSLWQSWLVDDAQAWSEGSPEPGSIRYTPVDVDAFFDAQSGDPLPVLMFVGRFLGFKRVPLLVCAYARARQRMEVLAPLVIWGGAPGEWEGEHPHTVARDLGVAGVYFVGWRGHAELPTGLACADVFVAPSTDEPFGQVYLEAMACGLPVIATNSGGPPSFINRESGSPDGWLIEPDDVDALADVMVQAVVDRSDREARGRAAVRHVAEQYSWDALVVDFEQVYDAAMVRSRGTVQ